MCERVIVGNLQHSCSVENEQIQPTCKQPLCSGVPNVEEREREREKLREKTGGWTVVGFILGYSFLR